VSKRGAAYLRLNSFDKVASLTPSALHLVQNFVPKQFSRSNFRTNGLDSCGCVAEKSCDCPFRIA